MKDEELDELIDRALVEYSSAEPMVGLEARVLRRVRQARSRRWLPRLAFAVPALAALILAWLWRPPVAPLAPAPRPPAPAAVAQVQPLPRPAPQPPRAAKRRRAVRALPREERFPAPTPMTREERALLAWAGRAPQQVRQALADLEKRSNEPVSIPAIQIQPLEIQ